MAPSPNSLFTFSISIALIHNHISSVIQQIEIEWKIHIFLSNSSQLHSLPTTMKSGEQEERENSVMRNFSLQQIDLLSFYVHASCNMMMTGS